ncbi:CinA family protein [Austwickia sp. TVS 96-490-7B]|uniref:CinA family protein n=1 Tax=Austwickia sp. TVS 96-490-7B TaxID=2830843 RepID=UPI001C57FE84|nr:CinA family protein [Austwickia sp. TVS 96-490-7B]
MSRWTEERSASLITALADRGETVATGESLTGGLVIAALVDVPGASRVVRGGAVVYHNDLKHDLLGVDATLLATAGPIQAAVAEQLAEGARHQCRATWGIGTTGIAGPEPYDGHPAGTVFVAVVGPGHHHIRHLHVAGSRHEVRSAALSVVLDVLFHVVGPG